MKVKLIIILLEWEQKHYSEINLSRKGLNDEDISPFIKTISVKYLFLTPIPVTDNLFYFRMTSASDRWICLRTTLR